MESIEAMRARFDAQIAEAKQELAIANACPVMPKRVQRNSKGMPAWLIYEAASLADALALLERMGEPVPFYGYKSTFTRFQPESFATDKSGEVTSGPWIVSLDVSQGKGYGPNAKLKAFVRVGDEVAQAHISIGGGYVGTAPQYAATAVYRSEGRGYHGNRTVLEWRANNALAADFDNYTKWGTGSNDSAHFEYRLSSDDVEGGTGHAFGAMWGIVERERRQSFSIRPYLESFLSIMLEDLQISENEEAFMARRESVDVGTIYTVPQETFDKATAIARRFADMLTDSAMEAAERDSERAGADLYLEAAGHGAGFADRTWDDDATESARIAAALSAAVPCRIETYIGDDGRAYISGGL